MVVVKSQLVPSGVASKVTSKGTNTRQYITVHETDNTNAGADASAHARLQANGNSRQASWHITVDDTQAIRSFPDTAICWHAGAKAPRVSGNPRSIGVEICVNSGSNYRKAVENAAMVVAGLMKENGIPIERVVQHNHWSGKNCPRHLRAGDWGVTWAQFKQMVLVAYRGGGVSVAGGNSGGSASTAASLPYVAVLNIGVGGAAVKRYQADLNTLGFKTMIDGQFGPNSKASTVAFQKSVGLAADGIAGPDTQAAMVRELQKLRDAQNQPKPAPAKPETTKPAEVDEMDKKLSKTQQDDMRKLLKKAYDSKVFTVDHTDKVPTMTRLEAFVLVLSYVARTAK